MTHNLLVLSVDEVEPGDRFLLVTAEGTTRTETVVEVYAADNAMVGTVYVVVTDHDEHEMRPSDVMEVWREPNTCRNCDKPGITGRYCSTVCEDMDRHPAPRDDMETLTSHGDPHAWFTVNGRPVKRR